MKDGRFEIPPKNVSSDSKHYLKFDLDKKYYKFIASFRDNDVSKEGYSNPQALVPGTAVEVNAGVRISGVVFSGQTWYDYNDNCVIDDNEAGAGEKVLLWQVDDKGSPPIYVKKKNIQQDGTFELHLKKTKCVAPGTGLCSECYLQIRLNTEPISVSSGK